MNSSTLIKIVFVFFLGLINPEFLFCQITNEVIRVEDDRLVIRIDKWNTEEYKNLMLYFGLNEDSLFTYSKIGNLAKEGWSLTRLEKNFAEISKPLNADVAKFDWGSQPIFFDNINPPGEPGYPGPVTFGANEFKKGKNVFENEKGETIFYLKNNINASKVFLSGNFNNWKENTNPMQKTDSGWIAKINLKPGKYFYKFIVDGNWIYDLNNDQKEKDGYSSYNSTYFRCNQTFTLNGYLNKKNVYLTGTFNDWREKELRMEHTFTGWQIPIYLSEGTHSYKFIVDGEWITDPANKNISNDGMGNFNSIIAMGNTTDFILNGFQNAHVVILTGTFNAWNTGQLVMQKTESGWKLPYVLAPGNYAYKFIVDGKWMTDPDNPYKIGGGEETNSVKVVEPNYTFVLNAFPNAKQVLLSGNFNNWSEPGYTMLRSDAGWIFPVHLDRGKQLYKYVVDGTWMVDPGNPLYEENEFGTGNSVMWVE